MAQIGRPKIERPVEWDKYYETWMNGKIMSTTLMYELGLSKSTFYRMVQAYQAELEQERLKRERRVQAIKELKQKKLEQKIKLFLQKTQINKTGG